MVFAAAHHEPWRDEVDPWLRVRDAASVDALRASLRHTGHPYLFYALLRAIAALGFGVSAIRVVHTATALAYGLVLQRAAPFPRWLRGLLLFGYFFVFEYAVPMRAYGLGLLALLSACVLFHRRKLGPLLVVLALMPHLSVHALILAGALSLALIVERREPRTVLALLPVAGSALVALWSMWPSADNVWLQQVGHGARVTWSVAAPQLVDALLPIPAAGPAWWNHGRLGAVLGGTGSLAVLVVLLGLALASLRRVPHALVAFASGAAGLLLLFTLVYFGYTRHHGHLWLIYVAAAWLAERDAPSRARRAGLAAVAALHVIAGGFAIARDAGQPFSQVTAAARYVDSIRDPRAAIVGESDAASAALCAFQPAPIHFPSSGRSGTYVDFDHGNAATDAQVVEAAQRLACERGAPSVIVIARPLPGRTPAASFVGGVVADEDFWIYREPCPR